MRLLKFALICMLLAAAGLMHAGPAAPKYDAALVKETEAFLRAIDKVLVVRDDGYDLKRRADHSRWGQDLKKRSEGFVGYGTDREKFDSPYRPCQLAVFHAVEIWMSRLSYESRPTKLNYDFVERAKKDYESESRECNAAKPTKG